MMYGDDNLVIKNEDLPPLRAGGIEEIRIMAKHMVRVYLAGPTGNSVNANWRKDFTEGIPGVEWVKPKMAEDVFFAADLLSLNTCDVLMAFLNPGDEQRTGTGWEMGWAYANSIPIVLIDQRQDIKTYGMLMKSAHVIVPDIGKGIEAVFKIVGIK